MADGTAPLGAIDIFHLVNDREMRRRGLAGNHCAIVVEVEGRLDIARLGARLDRARALLPELRFRLRGGFPSSPKWVPVASDDTSILAVHAAGSEPVRHAILEGLVAQRLSGERPWGADLIRGPDQDTFVFRWFHPLTDARGAARISQWLGSEDDEKWAQIPPISQRFTTSDTLIEGMTRREQGELAGRYRGHMLEHIGTPLLSLWTASGRPRSIGPGSKMKRFLLSLEETRAFDRYVRREAKLAEAQVLVLLGARLLDAVLVHRGLSPASVLVPVPITIDPKGSTARMFGNNVTMMALRLTREELAHPARAIASLAEQQRAIVRDRIDVAMVAAMDFAKHLPDVAFRALSRGPFNGEMGSLVVSNPGALGFSTFLGKPVVDAFPMPACTAPPGFQVIASRHAGRLSIQVLWSEGLLSALEASRLDEQFRAASPW